MAFDLNKLSQMAKSRPEEAKQKAQYRKDNREWLRISRDIALALHYYLRKMKMTQKELAEKLQVSPAYVGKLLKGQENLTLETICNIQNAIDRELISVSRPYEHQSIISMYSIKPFVTAKTSHIYQSKQNVSSGYSSVSEDAA